MSGATKRGRGTPRGPQRGTRAEVLEPLRYGPAPVTLPDTWNETLGPYSLVREGSGGVNELDARGWGAIIALAAGREALRCSLALPDGTLVEPKEREIFIEPPAGAQQASSADFVSCVADLVEDCATDDELPVVAAAIAWPGRIDHRLNENRGDPQEFTQEIGDWKGKSLAALVAQGMRRAGLQGTPPVYVLNDADADLLALTQPAGADREASTRIGRLHSRILGSEVALGVTVAGGVGGAISLRPAVETTRRTINRGGHGFAGELGTIPVDIWRDGLESNHKTRGVKPLKDLYENDEFPRWKDFLVYSGTLDHFACGRSIIDQLVDDPAAIAGGYNRVISGLKFGTQANARTRNVMERSGRLIGQALAGPVLTIDPDLIVVSSFADSKPLRDGIWENLSTWGRHIGLESDDIVMAPDDKDRRTKGAARWAIEQVVGPVIDKLCHEDSKIEVEHILEHLPERAALTKRV